MKNKACKLTVALLFLFCLAVPIFIGNMETEAADMTSIVEPYDATVAKTFFDNDTAPDCKTDGYIFAGWYAETDKVVTDSVTGQEYFEGSPLTSLIGYTGTTVQALFVEQSVLGVKGQIAIIDGDDNVNVANLDASAEDAATANLRLVTSVDTKKYASVGFEVSYTYNNSPQSGESITNFVYPYLTYVDGEGKDETLLPYEVFSERSKYFKACTLSGIPIDAFDMEVSVNTFWTTVDGAKVYGSEAVIKTVQEGVYHTYEAGVDETADGVTKATYYKVLEAALDAVKADTKTVTLFKDAEVASDTEISGTVTITNLSGKDVTLYRVSDLTSANMFSVASGGKLNILGAQDEESIVLDGNQVSAEVTLVDSDGGELNIENTTLRNALCNGNNEGGAIQASGGILRLINTNFFNNTSSTGGAVRTSATTTITGCVFGGENHGNVATSQGGAIYNQGNTTVVDTEFLNNKATSNGGAVYNNAAKFTVYNSKFAYNETTSGPGGAITTASSGSVLTLSAENENGYSNLALFEYNKAGATGGGAVNMTSGKLTVTGYSFSNNSAVGTGGAIRSNGCNVSRTISDATFTDNYTNNNSGHGGAIFFSSVSITGNISSTKFDNNSTKGSASHGGAVYIGTRAVAKTSISDSIFTNNYVTTSDSVNTSTGQSEGVYAK